MDNIDGIEEQPKKAERRCVYCGKIILESSQEHIIQNAIGGLLESQEICCAKCNNYVSRYIDKPFTDIFNPVIGKIEYFTKTNNQNSKPSYSGKAIYENKKIYDVILKNGKVVDCVSLKKELRRNITKDEYNKFTVITYDFKIENNSFKNGIRKIAFNFALDKGVKFDLLNEFLIVNKNGDDIQGIEFNNPVTSFVALNPFDEYLELNTSMELYHNLILFSQGNLLWCYVDLFNTFQFYVLLSKNWCCKRHIYESYLQLLQKIDRTIPEIHIRRTKDILAYAMYYNIEPCMDLQLLKRRICEAIQKESSKKNMTDIISAKIGWNYMMGLSKITQPSDQAFYLSSLQLYMDENDCIKEESFRQVTIKNESSQTCYSYPLLINDLTIKGKVDISSYTHQKFLRLNRLLLGIDGI